VSYISKYIHVYIVHMYMYMYVKIHVSIFVCVYTHTHTLQTHFRGWHTVQWIKQVWLNNRGLDLLLGSRVATERRLNAVFLGHQSVIVPLTCGTWRCPERQWRPVEAVFSFPSPSVLPICPAHARLPWIKSKREGKGMRGEDSLTDEIGCDGAALPPEATGSLEFSLLSGWEAIGNKEWLTGDRGCKGC
jgi:hypothetical protein